MTAFRVQAGAGRRLDDIYVHTRKVWGDEQASRYLHGLFAQFEDIAARRVVWRSIPAEFEVEGFYCRHEQHFIYWRLLSDGVIGIVTILHERMHQLDRFREDVAP
ncbi:plasmid stabilization protein [Polymorphobacter multimanifer]|uniref:Toxin ParE1/3/4 n=1 Tax=Polymorphobacter multimanifer TaxID=1070431 RepID=A0A841L4L2_9SPHN|nr:type II toxin-antitoxin system RelE/ParE family toxin [Polymorphobacter multimanifer]MBB6227360.1 toxin ParE1/3/4 [Polymorphobacter multimanifer]GGI80022.1 plasmid stabilization protein [Polymorphobacter multimanifer]